MNDALGDERIGGERSGNVRDGAERGAAGRNPHAPTHERGHFARPLERLAEDLIGPLPGDPVLDDFPADAFTTGILFPPREAFPDGAADASGDDRTADEAIADDPETDDPTGRSGPEDGTGDDVGPTPDETVAHRHGTLRPSTAGLSFALRTPEGLPAEIVIEVNGARYRSWLGADGHSLDWHRHAIGHRMDEIDVDATARIDLAAIAGEAFAGLHIAIVTAPHIVGPDGDDDGTTIRLVTVVLYNAGAGRATGEGANTARRDLSERALFETRMVVRAGDGSALVPRPRRVAAHGAADEDEDAAVLLWRDAHEYATGHTCAAHWEGGADGTVERIETTWLPATLVPAMSNEGASEFARMAEGLGESLDEEAFAAEALAEADDLFERLEVLPAAYRRWIAHTRATPLPAMQRERAERHLGRCEVAAARMEGGIEALRENADQLDAFRMANRAMALQWEWGGHGGALQWRPFQLGFVLLALASSTDRAHPDRETMDLVWFPTGGGKTEAYLLLTACTIFARRLRDGATRGAGVTAIMRYTLRLLTIQQFERAAAMICAAETVRRGVPRLAGGPPISLGLWLGSATTPNRVEEAARVLDGAGNGSGDGTATPRQLLHCPCCRSSVDWAVEGTHVVARCSGDALDAEAEETCALSRSGVAPSSRPVLPVHTVDEDVYAEQPSLVIATADKFAQIARNPRTNALFGHGDAVGEEGTEGPAPPDLIVQDELHLISGPLGTLAGLYETAIDRLCSHDGRRPKVIGSTATIRRASDQVRRLFARDTMQFPPPGVDADDSGFAVTDPRKPGRLYVGVTTAGRSKPAVLAAVCGSLLQSAEDDALPPTERDAIWTLVGYFNSLRELGGSVSVIQVAVAETMQRIARTRNEERREIDHQIEITSRVPSTEIARTLRKLERRVDQGVASEGDPVDVALATNMISVGVDVTRLGLMVVDGQPKGISEYIQATSRVGRGSTPGLVVGVFNANRARDRSRYETHRSWHEALYRDVEPTAVTPFAPRARDRALHAPLAALAAHGAPALWNNPALIREREVHLSVVRDAIVARVKAAGEGEELDAVLADLDRLLADWRGRTPSTWWDDRDDAALLMSAEHAAQRAAARRAARRAWPTPNSLRGVEATVNVELDGL